MKKIMFQCIGNVILFTLLGLAFMHPFSNINQSGETGFRGTITVFPILLCLYLIIYPIAYNIFKKCVSLDKKENSELAYSDEREKSIVSEAAIVAYKSLIGGIVVSIAILGGVRFFSLFSHEVVSIYFISILLLTIVLVVSMISYSMKWCIEYRK